MEKWTDRDEKNLFVAKTNILEGKLEAILNEIRKITNGHINMKNYFSYYQRKVEELEQGFKEHDLNYFDNNWVRRAVREYLTTEMLEVLEIIEIIKEKLNYLSFIYLSEKTSKFADFILERYVNLYNEKIEELENFSLKNNLVGLMYTILLDDRYYMYSKGDFIEFYKEMEEISKTFGFHDTFISLSEIITELVKYQEENACCLEITDYPPKTI